MIKVENTDVFGWEAAIRGARNPMNSWDRMDSRWRSDNEGHTFFSMGDNDCDLLARLSSAGADHGKFLRMINVTADVTAPLYWWKEYDTYKVGTVANSCSTMHKIHAKEFTREDFSSEHLITPEKLDTVIEWLNTYRKIYVSWGDGESCRNEDGNSFTKKDIWWQMIQLLPSSYNQLRTIQLNYQVLKNIYFARRNHKLDEWHKFCRWIETLPYSYLITSDIKETTR